MSRFQKFESDVSSVGRSGFEALQKSARSWGDGFKDFSKAVIASAQDQVERSKAGWEALQNAKSLKEAIEVQREAVTSGAARFRADASKMASEAVQNTKNVVEPLASQLIKSVKKQID